MHIQDFYSKLTSATEESRLFQALRSLSRIEDPKAVLNADPDMPMTEWAAWPAVEASAAALVA